MLNELAVEIHENAKAHGWWDKPRTRKGLLALVHSEVSEALEEYRNGHTINETYYNGEKPEGIPSELADVCIRCMDILAHEGKQDDLWLQFVFDIELGEEFDDFCDDLHNSVSKASKNKGSASSFCVAIAAVVALIKKYCKHNGIDIDEAIRVKHEYNKTRPFRHGGKRC